MSYGPSSPEARFRFGRLSVVSVFMTTETDNPIDSLVFPVAFPFLFSYVSPRVGFMRLILLRDRCLFSLTAACLFPVVCGY